jgi:small GTP-binding protein
VGKSTITQMFCKNSCDEEYTPTIESRFQKQIKFKGETFVLEIIDTAGFLLNIYLFRTGLIFLKIRIIIVFSKKI